MQIPNNYRSSVYCRAAQVSAVCNDSDESDEKRCCRLYRYGTVGKESMAGSTEVRPGECHCVQCRTKRLRISRTAAICRSIEKADYVYICENNTIYGTKYKKLPNTKGKILVSDVSSCFLSEPVRCDRIMVLFTAAFRRISDRQVWSSPLSGRI